MTGLKSIVNIPVLIGSRITNQNLSDYWHLADIFIVGSHFKFDGRWNKAVDVERVNHFMTTVQHLRQ